MKNNTLAAALSYNAAGLSIIPIRTDGSKAPAADLLPNGRWEPFKTNPPSEMQIREWFERDNVPGIGIIWGEVSGRGEALDFDECGLYERYAALCEEQGHTGLIESLPLVETPSGGRHLLYRCETPVSVSQKLAQRLNNNKPETLIETRGEAGYTIAPGSPVACHPDGLPYRFLRGRPATIPTITSEDRRTLLALATTFNEYVRPKDIVDYASKQRKTATASGLRPGDDFNLRGDWRSVLERHGWRRLRSVGDKGFWQRPGKTGNEVSATDNYGGSNLFYPFSSNAAPFEEQRGYSPFSIYALLEHKGDYAEAARELAQQDYGDPKPAQSPGQTQIATDVPTTIATLTEQAWPVADDAMFYGLAGDFVRVVEPHTEADPIALLVQMLTAFGSVIGRSAHFITEADLHFGNLFIVLVGISSKGRKGTSWGHVRRLFEAVAPIWATDCLQSGASSGEGLIWHVRDPVEKEIKNKKTGDIETVVVDPGVENKRLLIMEAEFASVLRVAGRDGNTLSAILRSAWDTGALQTMTKNDPVRASGAHVSLVGHVTADELRRELSSTEAGNGFANRFLWICARRSKELPEGGNLQEHELNPLIFRLQAAIQKAQEMNVLRRDDKAKGIWHAVYSRLSSGQPGLSGAVTSRSEAQVMRLALLYALLDESESIREEHLMAALALWEYVEASARYVFGDSMGDSVADDILRLLRAQPTGMTRSDLRDMFGRNQSSGRIGQALALLVRHNRAKMEREETEGRPVERWSAVSL